MNVETFANIYNGPLKRYLIISKILGEDLHRQSELVDLAFQTAQQYIIFTNNFKKPTNEHTYLKPLMTQIEHVQNFKCTRSEFSPHFEQHVSIIRESIKLLQYAQEKNIKEFTESTMNKVRLQADELLSKFKEDESEVEWINAWLDTLEELTAFISRFSPNGVIWIGQKDLPAPVLLGDIPYVDRNFDHLALFKDINQGEAIVTMLRQVNSVDIPIVSEEVRGVTTKEVFLQDGKKWKIENKQNDHNISIHNAQKDNVVYIFNCLDCTVVIDGKINVVKVDSCKKVAVIFRSLISGVEIISSNNIKVHAFGSVPSISIDSSTDIGMHVSKKGMDTQIYSSQSSRINLSYPFEDGYYRTFAIPTRMITTINPDYSLKTVVANDF